MTEEEFQEYLRQQKELNPGDFAPPPTPERDEATTDTAEEDAPFYRELQYGFDRSTWLGGNIYRYLAADGDQELLEEREKKRLKELDEKYKDLTTEEKQSGWSMAGEIGSTLLDPTAIPLYAVAGAGVAAKGAQLTMGAKRLLNAATQGSIAAGDYSVYELSKGNEVDPTWLAGSAGLGGLAGALLLPKNLKVARGDTSERVIETIDGKLLESRGKREGVIPNLEDGVQQFLDDTIDTFYKEAPDTIAEIVDNSNNGWKITAAKNILALHKEQRSLRKEFITRPLTQDEDRKFKNLQKAGTYLNDADFIKLEKVRKEAALFLRKDLPKIIADQSEAKSEVVMGTAGKLHVNGMLNTNTIAHAVYRPLIGAMGGFGISATTSMYSDSEFNPIPWMLAGATAGAISKKIVNSQYTSEIKKAGTDAAQTVIRNSLWAQANVIFSGSAAAKAQAFGGRVHDLSKALFEQVGFGLKGAAKTSVEEASELHRQARNHQWTQALDTTGAVGRGRAEEIRQAAFMLEEGFTDLPTLSKTFSDDELAKISRLGKEARDIVEKIADEVSFVGVEWKPNINRETGKVDYGLPQSHDTLKMSTDPNSREIYKKAFRLEKQAEAKAAGKDPSKIKIDESSIDSWFDTMITYGRSNKAHLSAFRGDTQGKKGIRPLASHFEQERFFKTHESRKLLAENGFLKTDIDHVMKEYIGQTVPIIEFARRFGSKGEGISAFKNGIRNDFRNPIKEAATEKERMGLVRLRNRNLDVVDEMVEVYFGKVHKSGNAANHQMSNAVMSIAVTGANLAYLPKVMISSLGELAQPFINSGAWNSMKGFARSLDKQTDIGQVTGFSGRDVANNELLQYQLQANLPNSKIQRGTLATNQIFFKYNGLIPFTMFTRRYAYNTGIERAFEISQKITKKRTTALQNSANAAGLSDDKIKILNKFDDLGEALKDSKALEILNSAGSKAANRDAILPTFSNRRAWSQSNNPYLKSLFQFLSWAQAKTTQTNAIVSRMEDGDHALFARMLGALALYDGIVTFKSFLNDPTGEWLDERDEDTYQEVYSTLENIGSGVQHSGNFNHVLIDKIARLASSHGGSHPIEELWPVAAWSTEMFDSYSPLIGFDMEGDVWRNIREGDIEGAVKKALKPLPLGDEVLDIFSVLGHPIENRRSGSRRDMEPIEIGGQYYSKGGVVEDVPRVPKEPDERIDKLTGRPYNEQAGGAFIDDEDPLKRLGFAGGGFLDDPLRRLGFVGGSKAVEDREEYAIGSLVARGAAKFMSRGARSQRHISPDEILNKNTDEIIAMDRKQIDLVSDEVIEEVPEILDDTPLVKQADEFIEEAPVAKADAAIEEAPIKTEYAKGLSEFEDIEDVDEWQSTVAKYVGENREVDPVIKVDALEESAKKLIAGEIDRATHLQNVQKHKPITTWTSMPNEPSTKTLVHSLNSLQRKDGNFVIDSSEAQLFDVPVSDLSVGDSFNGRLDIHAYKKFDSWIVAGTSKDHKGTGTHYAKAVHYVGKGDELVKFAASQKYGERIGVGEKEKKGYATVSGWVKSLDADSIRKKAESLLDDPDWIQIGFDPRRQGAFYTRSGDNIGAAVKEAEEVIQVGPLVLAKKAKIDLEYEGYVEGGKVYNALRRRRAEGGEEEGDDAALGEIAIGNDAMSDADDDFLLNKIREHHFRRLRDKEGLDVSDETAKENLRLLNAAIVLAESSDNFDALNVDSGAASLYQFKPESARTAAKRIIRTEQRSWKKERDKWLEPLQGSRQDWENWRRDVDPTSGFHWVEDVSDGRKEIMELTPKQQQILFEGDMFERKGSDTLLPDILRGDTDAMSEYYYKFHHTSPETQPNTKENWERSLEAVQERMSVE